MNEEGRKGVLCLAAREGPHSFLGQTFDFSFPPKLDAISLQTPPSFTDVHHKLREPNLLATFPLGFKINPFF
jgi:hypothetical protein